MPYYIAIPLPTDIVTDLDAAKEQAKQLSVTYGETVGAIAIYEAIEVGRYEYASPIWVPAPGLEKVGNNSDN